MSQPQRPTELIYLPKALAYPALLGIGLAGVIVGFYAWWPYSVAGGLLALFSLVGWLRANRAEMGALPNEQHTDTAPIPLR